MKNKYSSNRCGFFLGLILFIPLWVFAGQQKGGARNNSDIHTKAGKALGAVNFRENRGQLTDVEGKPVPHVLYKGSATGVDLYVTNSGLTYVFFSAKSRTGSEKNGDIKEPVEYEYNTIDVRLKGANINSENIIQEEKQAGQNNYFLPHCPGGLYGISDYRKLTVKNVYPGIDWVLYNSDKHGFKYDFIVHPGADYSDIKLEYVSLAPAVINSDGAVVLRTRLGKLIESAPYSYLKKSSEERQSSFRLISSVRTGRIFNTTIAIKLTGSALPPGEDLIIDPQLTWCTFYGGNTHEGPRAIETDDNGNIFATGGTSSFNLPLVNSSTYYQGTKYGISSQFIVKFAPNLSMQWATYYGGGGAQTYQSGYSLAIDTAGNVFMLGTSNATNFPVSNNSTFYQGSLGGSDDATIIKFNNSGVRLWATYYGGTSLETAYNICTDASGNIFITGTTESSNLPLLNASTFFQGTSTLLTTGYIAKFDNAGTQLWGTLYDGLLPTAATIDASNNLAITGTGSSSVMPLMNPGGGAYYQATASITDAAIVKFSNTGSLLWSTYFGAANTDFGRCITSDNSGNIFVAGVTTSTNFPLQTSGTSGYMQSTIGSTGLTIGDAFIAKFSGTGALLWSTYYGGNDYETFFSHDNLCVDSCGNVYMAFDTKSSNLSTKKAPEGGFRDSVFDYVSAASFDAYIVRFSNSGVRQWGTYFGGNGLDNLSPIAVDQSSNLFVAAQWTVTYNQSGNYPLVSSGSSSYYDNTSNGDSDISFSKFSPAMAPQSFSYSGQSTSGASICQSQPSATISSLFLAAGGTFSATPGLSINPSTGMVYPVSSNPGTYTVTYAYTYSSNLCGPTVNSVVTTTLAIQDGPMLSFTGSSVVCIGSSAIQTVSGAAGYTWSTGAQTSTASLSPIVSSVYTVTGIGQTGCLSSATTAVTVLQLPTLTVSGVATVCAGGSITQTVSGASTYTWSTGAQTSTISANPIVNTSYTVHGTDPAGCTSSVVSAVTTLTLPILTIAGVDTICQRQAVMKSVSGALNYTWSTGAITQSIVVNPSVTTVYSVTGEDQFGCSSVQSTTVVVFPVPALQVSGNTTICAGESATFSASGAVTYSWDNGAQTSTVQLNPALTSTVYLIGMQYGCETTHSFIIVVNECVTTPELSLNTGFEIFPNPNHGEFTLISDRETTLLLYTTLGQLIQKISLSEANRYQVRLVGLPIGVYLIRPQTDRQEKTFRVVVE
jgi:hypothetical protein